jgi:hypothetical protein
MSEYNLLPDFALVGCQLVKTYAEILRAIPAGESCQARVELNLTPQAPDPAAGPHAGFVLVARFGCLGLPSNGDESQRLFALEVVVNAAYRQERGAPMNFADFQRHHVSLTRQLFPVLQQHATRLLNELGLFQIRLPHDLVPAPTPVQQITPGPLVLH